MLLLASAPQGDDMPDLEEHALLKKAHPDLVLFQDLVAERPGETWNDVVVRLLEPVQSASLVLPSQQQPL